MVSGAIAHAFDSDSDVAINRVHDKSVTVANLTHIVTIQLESLRARLAGRRISLLVTDAALSWLATDGFDPAFGARPLKRTIQREISDPASVLILQGEVGDGDTLVVDAIDGHIAVAVEGVSDRPTDHDGDSA